MHFEGLDKEIPSKFVGNYIKGVIGEKMAKKVLAIKGYPDFHKLMSLVDRRNEAFYALEKFEITENYAKNRCWPWGKVDKSAWIKKAKDLDQEIDDEVTECVEKNIGYGFIYCSDVETVNEILKNAYEDEMVVSQAANETDIIWGNMSEHKGLSIFKRVLTNSFFVLLFLILLTPLTLSSLISQLVEDLEFDLTFASQSISSIILSLFQYILVPHSIRILTNQEQHMLKSEQASSRIFKALTYTLMNIILFPLIGSVTLTVFVQKILNSEIYTWSALLSENISKVGDFFVSFIISMAFVSNSLDLMAFSSYLLGKVSEWKATTFQEELKATLAPSFDFAHEYSKILTVFAVSLIFSVSNPVILPFGVLYLFIKYWVDKYNLLFAYRIDINEVLTTQKTVIVCLIMISALFQSINSGLFIVAGTSVMVWLGGILSAFSVITVVFGVLVFKYWNAVQGINFAHCWSLKYDFTHKYTHPCESFI